MCCNSTKSPSCFESNITFCFAVVDQDKLGIIFKATKGGVITISPEGMGSITLSRDREPMQDGKPIGIGYVRDYVQMAVRMAADMTKDYPRS